MSDAQLANTLAHELQAAAVVLMIDDHRLLDQAALNVVDLLSMKLNAPVVMSTEPLPQAQRRDLPQSMQNAERIPLLPLSFDEIADLLTGELETGIEPALVARIVTKAAGIPGIALELARASKVAGLISLQGDVWSMTGASLWNWRLETSARRFLNHLSPREYRAAFAIGLAGNAPLEQCLTFAPRKVLIKLSQRGLLTTIGRAPENTLVALTPPLLADYFQHQTLTPERSLVLMGLPEPIRDRVDDSSPAENATDGSLRFHDLPGADAAITRYFQERSVTEEQVRWDIWTAEPTVASAVQYLELAITTRIDAVRLNQVIAETALPHDGWSPSDYNFVALSALTKGLEGRSGKDAARHVENLGLNAELLTSLRPYMLMVHGLLGDIEEKSLDELEDLSRSELSGVHRDLVLVTRGFMLAVFGRSSEALETLSSVSDRLDDLPRRLFEVARGLALFSVGDLNTAVSESMAAVERARHDLDRDGIFLHSYLATLPLVRMGRWAEAEQVLGLVLSLGRPSRLLSDAYSGMARLTAMLASRSGNPQFALALLDVADESGVRAGMLPGAQIEISSAVRHLIDHEDDAASLALKQAAVDCQAEGYLLAAISAQQYSLCLSPHLVDAQEHLALVRTKNAQSHEQFAEFAVAVLTEPARAEDLARAYHLDVDAFLAILLLRTLSEQSVGSGEQSIFDSAIIAIRNTIGIVEPKAFFDNKQNKVDLLTPRELEIAALIGNRTNYEIATSLHLSVSTVANHISSALRKLNLSSRSELFEAVRRQMAERG